LPARLVLQVWPKRRNRRELLTGLPMILGFLWAGIAGEMAGYLRGDGGSLAQVR
jgi:hypothetical protein